MLFHWLAQVTCLVIPLSLSLPHSFIQYCALTRTRLRITSDGELQTSGFSSLTDSTCDDEYKSLWRVATRPKSDELRDIIVSRLSDSFAAICRHEIEMHERFASRGSVWKKLATETRDMCDGCNTSIFNGHMACLECGFSVCYECYESREQQERRCWFTLSFFLQPFFDQLQFTLSTNCMNE